MTSNYEKVLDFHKKMGLDINVWPPSQELLKLRNSLLTEEFNEVYGEMYPSVTIDTPKGEHKICLTLDKKELAKELADLLYVTYGTAVAFGIDLDNVFAEVHRSNMSKLGPDGKPVYNSIGKVMKGPSYTPPDLSFLEKEAMDDY